MGHKEVPLELKLSFLCAACWGICVCSDHWNWS